MLSNIDRKINADRILYEYGLMKKLEEIGKSHIIGSYRMDMMAWNDLDIDICCHRNHICIMGSA